MLPDHLVHGIRPEASPIARQPVGTGPFRFAGWEHGKRIRLERAPEYWGEPPGVDEIVFDLDPDAVRALNRTRRGDIDVLSRVHRRALPGSGRADHAARRDARCSGCARAGIRSSRSTTCTTRWPTRASGTALAMLWDRARFAGELHNDLARPIGGPPLERRHPGAAARSAARRGGARRRRLPRQRRRRRARSPGPPDPPHAARAGRQPAVPHRGARLRAGGAQGRHPGRPRAGRRGDDPAAGSSTASTIWRRSSGRGRPTRIPSRSTARAGAFNYGGYRSSALDALLDEARGAAGPAARAPILDAHRAPARRRAAGDLPLPLRRPRAGLDARPRPGGGRRPVRSAARLARAMIGGARSRWRACWRSSAARARRQACLPADAAAGPGRRRSVPARPTPKATELNAAGEGALPPGEVGGGARAVPRRRGRRSRPSWRRASTSPARSCARSGSPRRSPRCARCSSARTSPGRARCWRRPIWARSRSSPRWRRSSGRWPQAPRPGAPGLEESVIFVGRLRAPLHVPPDGAGEFILNPHQEVFAFLAGDGPVPPAHGRGRPRGGGGAVASIAAGSSTSPPRSWCAARSRAT